MENTDTIQMLIKVSWYEVFNYKFQSSYYDKQSVYAWMKWFDFSLNLLHGPDAKLEDYSIFHSTKILFSFRYFDFN